MEESTNIERKQKTSEFYPVKVQTTYWDDGHVDMYVTKLLAGETDDGWRSVSKKDCDIYTDVFTEKRKYRSFRREHKMEYKGRFSCVENF
jgi:SPX domain protein involved in polyphosphate accumulation